MFKYRTLRVPTALRSNWSEGQGRLFSEAVTGKLKTFVEAGVRMGMDIRKVFWAPKEFIVHCWVLCVCVY